MLLERHEALPDPDLLDAAAAVYERAFAQPPYAGGDSAEDFRDRAGRYAGRRGVRLTLLREPGGEVAGVALSVRAHPGDWWRDRVAAALGPARTAEWLEPAIREVVHVAVAPDLQGQGAGRLLIEDALRDDEAAAVVLSVHPNAERAKRLYRACGFVLLLEDFCTAPGQLGFWLMASRPFASP